MRNPIFLSAALLSASQLALSFTPAAAAPNVIASHHRTETSRACIVQANKKKLTGRHRSAFLKTCGQGALATTKPTLGPSAGRSAQAITAPSGADRDTRSAQCSAEALRRHLSEIQAKDFRLSCLATAGPVQESQDQVQAPKPAPAKPSLDTLPRPHQG